MESSGSWIAPLNVIIYWERLCPPGEDNPLFTHSIPPSLIPRNKLCQFAFLELENALWIFSLQCSLSHILFGSVFPEERHWKMQKIKQWGFWISQSSTSVVSSWWTESSRRFREHRIKRAFKRKKDFNFHKWNPIEFKSQNLHKDFIVNRLIRSVSMWVWPFASVHIK